MAQNTNLNASPYFDDFDVDKNYKRVLFKPGTPIQARELTTMQSILQNQVEKFGKHFFKEGEVVIPGSIAYDPEYTCVQIDANHLGIDVSLYIDKLVGQLIKGEISGVTAKVENYISDTQSEEGNYTLYVKYQSAGEGDFETNTFVDGENLLSLQNIDYGLSIIKEDSSFATAIVSGAIRTGSAAKIEEGVYFIRGFFIDVKSQTILLDQYDNSPSYRVGLFINEEIAVASQKNADLYDNARGFSNFAAPGADRLKISTELTKKPLTDTNDEAFIELMRIENGVLLKFSKKQNVSSLITDELARRTYDESGNYYVNPFKVIAKESVNDSLGNNGIYGPNETTSQGNTPSPDLLALQLSPGKAYVKGYEVETINTVFVDVPKPRTTQQELDTTIPFSFGNQIELNNVYGGTQVGYGSSSQVTLYNERTASPGTANGIPIGVARVYDMQLKNDSYSGADTIFVASLYDVNTYTYITINAGKEIALPALIEGQNSNARGYLKTAMSKTDTQMVLYQVSGTFNEREPLRVNGKKLGRTVKEFRDYGFGDVRQLVSLDGNMTADIRLSQPLAIAPQGTDFTINAAAGGESDVTCSSNTFGVGIQTGDILAYNKKGETSITLNRVKAVNATGKEITLEATTSVTGVSIGALPTSDIETGNLFKLVPELFNAKDSYLFAELEYADVATVDLSQGDLVFKKSYDVTISGNALSATLESDPNVVLEPFDEEDYTLVYNDGTIEGLEQTNASISGRTITLGGLSQNGAAVLTATLRKNKLKSRNKVYNRCATLNVERSNSRKSGTGAKKNGDGLTFSRVYGTRVQDNEISLLVPDVQAVLGVFESDGPNEPTLPKLTLENLNANILNGIQGEQIVGQDSEAIAVLVSNNGSNEIDLVYQNENSFIKGEKVVFQESNLTANVTKFTEGDKDIANDFIFNPAQYLEYADYSFLVRKEGVTPPTRKLKIVFNHFYIEPSDDGDITTVSSYDASVYTSELPYIDFYRANEILDARPRVKAYDLAVDTLSPFEYNARTFETANGSTPFFLSRDKNIKLSYDYYLGRIDKLFVNRYGEFFLKQGVPALNPRNPEDVPTALEIATIEMPPYVYNINDITIALTDHKRFRMQDIARMEDRLKNVEYYTSLSLLESETKNLTLRDSATGLDKFKTGFFVDNFRSTSAGSLGDPMHKCSIDMEEGHLRPQHYSTQIDMLLGSEAVVGTADGAANPDADLRFVEQLGTPNSVKKGDVICFKYKHEKWLENKFATRYENVNPFHVVNWIGAIEMNPATDTWIDTKKTKKTIDQEGNYESTIQELGIDTNTGLSPIQWGAWETTWTGKKVIGKKNMGSIKVGSKKVGTSTHKGKQIKGRGIPITTTTKFRDKYTKFTNVTTLTTKKQAREGIQYKVSEVFETVELGPKVVSTEVLHTMRSRNIEFVARRLKPTTKLFPFFDNVLMTKYTVPKLIEIQMISGTFKIGEDITGSSGTHAIKARLAKPNHKYGPYKKPSQTYTINPYKTGQKIPGSYSSTSTILNLDTASLELQSASGYYGNIVKGMKIKGKTSGAIAKVTNVRLVTDNAGTLIGSLFLPDPKQTSKPSFETGTKTFTLTTSKENSTISGATDSTAESTFTASGTLQNIEETTLRIRNAQVDRLIKTDERTKKSKSTKTKASTTFKDRTVKQTRWVDPLAQSFEVPDERGVFISKIEVYFRTKDKQGLPVTGQIRTMQTGLPTTEILPFGEVVLEPVDVKTSKTGTVPTTFEFPSPVYLETGQSYCFVLLSASNEYTVFISRMGEEDVTTVDKPESEKIIVSSQPLLGSLFKSQNGATWDPSQLEDLKFTVYRSKFKTGETTFRFYNPDLDLGNGQIATLKNNPADTIARSALVGIGTSLSSAEQTDLTPGVTMLQEGNSGFSATLDSVVGSIGIGSDLTLTAVGSGFTTPYTAYDNVSLIAITGEGTGGKVELSVQNGVAIAATVSAGGTGYASGDALTINYDETDGIGKNLILTIPEEVGAIGEFNGFIMTNIQGEIEVNATDEVFYVGTSSTVSIPNANVTFNSILSDGRHFKVTHRNHGMYDTQDRVRLYGFEPDTKPVQLTANYKASSTGNLTVESVGIFTSFENLPVDSLNPGYVLIDDEVIKYTGVSTSAGALTGITRGVGDSKPGSHETGDSVFKYEMSGVSLRRINKTHIMNNTDFTKYPTGLDNYHIKWSAGTNGGKATDRTNNNPNDFPKLYFREDKSCGSYDVVPLSTNLERGPKATQNITYDAFLPNFQMMLPEGTNITAKARTFSGSTPDSGLSAYIDQGFEDCAIGETNELTSPRVIASPTNENLYLQDFPGKKSFTIELTFSTDDDFVSPMIDLDRVSLILINNRINEPIKNYATDFRANSLTEDPTSAVYLSKIVELAKSADSLKVYFDAFKHPSSDIRVGYRLFRVDAPQEPLWELFPGFENLDVNGQVIDQSNNDGHPDTRVPSSSSVDDFGSYEFTIEHVPQFEGFQIKIWMTGSNSAYVPKIKDLRAIASI